MTKQKINNQTKSQLGLSLIADESNDSFEENKSDCQEKKDVGTLSNPLSGDTKQGGGISQGDIKLQNERSASLPADNHPDTDVYKFPKLTIKQFEQLEGEPEHGQEIDFPHKFFQDYYTATEKDCNGKVTWESVMEGLVCSKCGLYTGVK